MDPATVQALRDVKSLFDDGILTEAEFASKKAELLNIGSSHKSQEDEAISSHKKKARSQVPEGSIPSASKKARGLAVMVRDCGAGGVLVSGEGTFKARAVLKALGGSWSAQLSCWKFPPNTQSILIAGLEKSTVPEIDVIQLEPKSIEDIEKELDDEKQEILATRIDKDAKVEIMPHKRAIVVLGETKELTKKLKALGGKFNVTLHGWVFSKKHAQYIVDTLRTDPKVIVQPDATLGIISSSQQVNTKDSKVKLEVKEETTPRSRFATQDDDDDNDSPSSGHSKIDSHLKKENEIIHESPPAPPAKKATHGLWSSSDEPTPAENKHRLPFLD